MSSKCGHDRRIEKDILFRLKGLSCDPTRQHMTTTAKAINYHVIALLDDGAMNRAPDLFKWVIM